MFRGHRCQTLQRPMLQNARRGSSFGRQGLGKLTGFLYVSQRYLKVSTLSSLTDRAETLVTDILQQNQQY